MEKDEEEGGMEMGKDKEEDREGDEQEVREE